MADDSQVTLRDINWREAFPFTHLFRGFRIAIHPSKLVLGLLLLLSLYVGGRILDGIWPSASKANYSEVLSYEQFRYRHNPSDSFSAVREQERLSHVNEYADRLQAAGIVSDRQQAVEAARHGEYFRDLEKHEIAARNERIKHEQDERDAGLKEADAITDTARRERHNADINSAFKQEAIAEDLAAQKNLRELRALAPRGIYDEFFTYETAQANLTMYSVLGSRWMGDVELDSGPAPTVFRSVTNFLVIGPAWLVSAHPIFFIFFAIWFLIVWAIFGGAISRIAAVHVARDEKISVRQALTFSFSKLLSFVFAPVIPMMIILVAGLAVAIGGLVYYVPILGPIAAALLFPIALIAGFVMTLVALGTLGGFDLMYPTIAVEGSDSFDAISRSFSYVFARPWRMIFYTIVALAYGALCYLFVRYFIYVLLSLTHFFISWFLRGQPGRYFPDIWPVPDVTSLIYTPNLIGLKWSECIASIIMSFWIYLVISMLGAFAISFYFSSNTIIYYLMRREVDATELDDVYVEESDDEFADLPPAATTPAASAGASAAVVIVETPTPASPPPGPSPAV